ncbi:MAG: hypothetical protein HY319_09820 [Armatimonadetes bacterium]|nr:hypothetical protein [Armatimonadota bacterium]
MKPTLWWKSTLLLLALGATLGGAGWMALEEDDLRSSAPPASLSWIVTSTRAS